MQRFLLILSFCLLLMGSRETPATPPTLYSQMANESPVHGDPGDLLMIAGAGFASTDTVVYTSLSNTTLPLSHPASVPATSTATTGVAPVVNTVNVPSSLVVSLPAVMTAKQSYALWVRNASGEWSNGVRINDARPNWISPDKVYVGSPVASLPRYLKVVGRNLRAMTGATTQVKLTGPATYTLIAADDGNPATAIEDYVANVTLPTILIAGTYNVSVSRDGSSWVPLSGQTLTVAADPPVASSFPVTSYGCSSSPTADATACVLSAIADASSHGGGTVTFPPGTWLINSSSAAGVAADGIIVPANVNLRGSGVGVSFVERGAAWAKASLFVLQGPNVVQGLNFKDLATYTPSSTESSMLLLGVRWRNIGNGPSRVSNVTITHNLFDKPWFGIWTGTLPMDHIYITYNQFGAYYDGINLSGDPVNVGMKYHMDDSIFAFNTFRPGSFTAPIASELSPANRFDFSGNVADGTVTSNQFLNNPGTDPTGWRAGFFWSMSGNIQSMLVSQNTVYCPGDKGPDGEGIAYDFNRNVAALSAAQAVISATSTTVTVAGPLTSQIFGTVTLPADYFSEHWLTVADGPGRGQVRKIVSYTGGSSGMPVTFTVTPAWDVIPQSTSTRILAEREYWQVYTVDNTIDQRTTDDQGAAQCTKGNTSKPMGGVITLYGPTADSAVEGNQQRDTSGIMLYNQYTVNDPNLGSTYYFQNFIDVRNNTVDGEYNWDSYCSWSGIGLSMQAGPGAGTVPPAEAYGVSIAHNNINHADGLFGGAIWFSPGWYEGPAGTNWDLLENVLVFGNSISNVNGPPAGAVSTSYTNCAANGNPRVGFNIQDAHVFHTILASNSCTNVAPLLQDFGTQTQKICASNDNACECPAGLLGYWKFDEGSGSATADSSGGGEGGTLVNGPVWTTGKTGGALSFSAAASYVAVNGTGAIDDIFKHGMTVTAWINPAGAGGGGGGRIVDKDNDTGGWFLRMNPSGTSLMFAGDEFDTVGTTPGTAAVRNSTNSIVLNQWQHVAVTWDGSANASNIHWFINGVPADDPSPTNGSGQAGTDVGTPLTIGNRPFDKARNFNGSIDGARIYNRQLTQAEIQSMVTGGS